MTTRTTPAPERGRNDQSVDTPAGLIAEEPQSRAAAAVYLGCFVVVLFVALAINVLGNGTKLLPSPGYPSDSDRAWKARRIEALAQSGEPPQVLILGSSRVMNFEPKYIEKLTGYRGFNCGVSVGCPIDMLAFVRLALAKGIVPDLLVIGVDELSFGDCDETDFYDLQLVTSPQLFQYVPFREQLSLSARAFKTVTMKSTRESLANIVASRNAVSESATDSRLFDADGVWRRAQTDRTKDRAIMLAEGIEDKVKHWYPKVDTAEKVERMRPTWARTEYFRELLTLARRHGMKVCVALLPNHPEYDRRVIGPRLEEVRHELSALLERLCTEFAFTYKDLSDLTLFGGKPEEFIDGVHMTEINTRKLLDVLLGDLTSRKAG